MKKIFLIIVFLIGLKNFSYSQFAGKGGSEKSGSFFSRIFRGGQKPLKQTQHFGKQKKDPNLKNNGTSYKSGGQTNYVVNNDGFGTAKQSKMSIRRKRRAR